MVKKTPAARAGRFDQVLAEMRRNPGKVYTLADLLPVYGGTLGGLGQALGKAAREGMVGKAGRGRFFVGPAQKAPPAPKGKPDAPPREKAATPDRLGKLDWLTEGLRRGYLDDAAFIAQVRALVA